MRRPALLTGLGVALAAFLVHAGSLRGGFVYDDHRFVVENAAIRAVDPVAFFSDASTASAGTGIAPDVYRPLRTLDFSLDHMLFGLEPFGWHLHSLLWHALAAVLVFRLLLPLFRGRLAPSAFGALLFAVHPVTSEAVAWVSSRGDLMAVALACGSLILLERPGLARTAGGAALAVLACFAKESAVVVPALLLLRDLALPREDAPPRRTTWLRVLLLGALVAGYLAARLAVIPGLAQVQGFPGGSRVATARAMLAGLAWYAEVLVWPHGFPFDAFLAVPLGWGEPAVVVGAGLLLTLVLAGTRGLLGGSRLVAFATLGALACLLPVSNVLVPLKALVAERFLYPVLIAVGAGAGALLAGARGRLRLPAGLLAVAVLAILAPLTWERDRPWREEASLWDAVRRDRPDNPSAYQGIAYAAFREGRADLAERAYRSYLEHNPDDGKSWMLLGHVFGRVAQSLYVRNLEAGTTTDVREKREQALLAQLSAYRSALAAWDRVGLVVGRGSPELVRETQRRRRDAAWRLGDLREAHAANDGLLALEGLGALPPEEVLRKAPYDLRLARLSNAFQATLRPLASLPAPLYERTLGTRQELLRAVGIDPGLSTPDVLARLEPLYAALAAEPGDRVEAGYNHAQVLLELGRKGEAIEALEAVLRARPDRRDVREEIERLRRGGS